MAFYTQIPSGAIRVTGTDRLDFVQGQVAQNIKTLPTPGGARSMILNVKGQIEFDVIIYRRNDDIYLQTAADLGDAVMARLQKYIVFDDVKLENISDRIRVLHISGEQAFELVSSFGFSSGTQLLETDFGTLLVAEVQRGNGNGFDVHVLDSKYDELLQAFNTLGATELSADNLERRRIVSGLANAHSDGFTGMLPQECGLLEGVSFKKGCYVGQEIMARLDARGHSNKTLVQVKLEQPLETGTPVICDGREIGQLGHVVPFETGFTALAVIRIDALEKPNLEAGGLKLEVDFSSQSPKL
jgi:tRNA-modifying protein YgfZ